MCEKCIEHAYLSKIRNGCMYQSHFGGKLSSSFHYAVPDPDLKIRGEEGSSRPLDGAGGGAVVSKKFFPGPSGLSLV